MTFSECHMYFYERNKPPKIERKIGCNIGDTVKVMETRPLSKDKRWRLVEIVEKAR